MTLALWKPHIALVCRLYGIHPCNPCKYMHYGSLS